LEATRSTTLLAGAIASQDQLTDISTLRWLLTGAEIVCVAGKARPRPAAERQQFDRLKLTRVYQVFGARFMGAGRPPFITRTAFRASPDRSDYPFRTNVVTMNERASCTRVGFTMRHSEPP
jgi:hypothetical protein